MAHAFHISPNFSVYASKRRDSPLHSLPHSLGFSDLSILKNFCKQHSRRFAAHLLVLNAAGYMDDKTCPPFYHVCCYCDLYFLFSEPPPRCKKRCASLSSPMGNVAHAHGQRCTRPRTTLPTPEDNEQERFSYRRRRALCHCIVCARAVRLNKPKHPYVAAIHQGNEI